MDGYMAIIKWRDGGTYEYGVKVQEHAGSLSGSLSMIITKDNQEGPTVMIDSNDLCESSFTAQSIEGIMKLSGKGTHQRGPGEMKPSRSYIYFN